MPRNNPTGKGLPNTIEVDGTDEEKALAIKTSLASLMNMFDRKIVKDEKEGLERTQEYIDECMFKGMRPTVEGWALALGTTRSSLWDWETGRRNGPLSADFVKKGKEMFAAFDADMVNMGRMNPVTYIFRSKNYYGMKDQQDIVVTPKQDVDVNQLIADAEILPDDDDIE